MFLGLLNGNTYTWSFFSWTGIFNFVKYNSCNHDPKLKTMAVLLIYSFPFFTDQNGHPCSHSLEAGKALILGGVGHVLKRRGWNHKQWWPALSHTNFSVETNKVCSRLVVQLFVMALWNLSKAIWKQSPKAADCVIATLSFIEQILLMSFWRCECFASYLTKKVLYLLLDDSASSEKYVDSGAINCREVTEKQSKIGLRHYLLLSVH